ncbi:MAG TPA: hypothetical protein VEZ47_09300 [Gemmatirosa sp.]|nr:hypothetical protein [Gemmatirosa sp.]
MGGEGVLYGGTQWECDSTERFPEILIVGLTPGAPVTLRASAPGYVMHEVTAHMQLGGAFGAAKTEILLAPAGQNTLSPRGTHGGDRRAAGPAVP